VEGSDTLGTHIVNTLGEPAALELLDVLTRSEADRAALTVRLYRREDARWLAEVLIDIETDPDDITRMRLADGLRRVLSS
jgi:hypothetical protein